MKTNRRQFLATAASLAWLQARSHAAENKIKHLGIVQYSYAIRLAAERTAGKVGLADPLAFLEHAHDLGAGGVQVGIGQRDRDYCARLRRKAEEHGMFLEGTIRLPRDRADLERFTMEASCARDAGVKILRTVMLGGRRYEQFARADDFRQACQQAEQAVTRAEPILAKLDLLLAIENHKDYRAPELANLLQRIDSRHVGACVDLGNSIALLEDPLEVVKTLAPRALTVHLKDMAVAEYAEGFLLAEVPLGQGCLDLPKMMELLRQFRSEIRFNLEMITRDPLRVPCLTDKYWATAVNIPGRDLARTLQWIRKHKPAQPLPRMDGREQKEQLDQEEANVRKSLTFAQKRLALS